MGIIGVAIFQEKYNMKKEVEDIKKMIDDKFPPTNPFPFIPTCPHTHPCPHECPKPWRDPIVTWQDNTFYLSNGSGEIMSLSSQSVSSSGENASALSVERSSVNNIKRMSQIQEIGTGWGESKKSEVVSVEFDREGKPSATFELYYNTRKQLERIGIDFSKKAVYVTPQAFPGQYCKPPKN